MNINALQGNIVNAFYNRGLTQTQQPQNKNLKAEKSLKQDPAQKERLKALAEKQLVGIDDFDASRYLKEILRITDIFNRKLKYSINQKSGQVVVKVINSDSNRVIKEIPSKELQKLHMSLKEALSIVTNDNG